MQSKGAVKLFAILLALVCLYQLSFTLVTKNVEKNAKEFAAGDPAKEKSYIDSINTQRFTLFWDLLTKSVKTTKST